MFRLTALPFLAVLLLSVTAHSQLSADFNLDKESGCSPLLVQFTNTTRGASANASYRWDFGNGNTSSLQNAGAIFQQEKTYTITLTVRDGNETSTKTKTVSVHKKPEVDFSVSVTKGCLPLPVQFTGNAKAGDGTISTYNWDFGDGEMQAAAQSEISHTYTSAQKAGISLTVTNSFGCYATVSKKDVIYILPALKADFSTDKRVLCKETDSVRFTNRSKGPGTLSYSWNFGDGTTSTTSEPSYAFDKHGSYTVTLNVKSDEGCTATKSETDYLNVANYKTVFTTPALVCRENDFTLTNQSTPNPDSFTWELDGSYYSNNQNSPRFVFHRTGTHKIKLTNLFGTCVDSATATFTVKDIPPLRGFVADVKNKCGAPSEVQFRDTTNGAVKWEWDFTHYSYNDPTIMSTLQAPVYSYRDEGYHQVFLRITNSDGCQNGIAQQVLLKKPFVDIAFEKNTGDSYNSSCDSMRVKLWTLSADSLTSYLWRFSDGDTSAEAKPMHTFTKPGIYTAFLDYVTADGCKGTSYSTSFHVLEKPDADFYAASDTLVCGNTPVTLKSISERYWLWDYWFIDGKYSSGSYYNNYIHNFDDSGTYSIMHVVYNDGCRDTVIKENYIRVLQPFPKITEVKNTCEGDRGLVTFTQRHNPGEKWIWEFGDGDSLTTATEQLSVSHQYRKTGRYKARLTVTNGACTMQDSIDVFVMLKQSPVLTATKSSLCADEPFQYQLSNLEKSSYPWVWVYHWLDQYQYGDGTTVMAQGYASYDDWVTDSVYNGKLPSLIKGQEKIRIITKEVFFNCLDTSNYVPISIVGAVAGFQVIKDSTCFTAPVILKDTSRPYNTKITSWQWDFGDGTQQIFTQGGALNHIYSSPGLYQVQLKIQDSSGCTSTTSATAVAVEAMGPQAVFTASGTNVPLNTTVFFQNNSNIYGAPDAVYTWDFGDASPLSSEYSPSHTYTKAGTYKVKLIANSVLTVCRSEAQQVIVVKNFNSAFTFQTSYLHEAKCPPVVARFTNTSVNYTRVRWDFGDGFTAENVHNPTHLYDKPGKYMVTLYVYAPNGVEGKYVDSIVISQPTATLQTNLLQSCTAETIKLTAKGDSNLTYWWDLGDGTIQRNTDSSIQHLYSRAGIYHPKLLLIDTNGCATSVKLDDPIVIDSLYLKLNSFPANICTPKEIQFQPFVNSASPQTHLNFHWNYGTGTAADTSNLQNPKFTFSKPGTYLVRLQVKSNTGCTKEVTETINALEGLGGIINGPAEICQGGEAQFKGATLLPGQPQWKWIFHDGTTATTQNAPVKKYNTPGDYAVQLVVNNNGCQDTVRKTLTVNPVPVNILQSSEAILCKGSSLTVTASGGTMYQWSPAAGLTTATGNSVIASPQLSLTYTVTATTEKECSSRDSIRINVVQPFVLSLPAQVTVCESSAIELKASGASTYQWIGNTAGLSNTSISNPVATPSATMHYAVVGTDAYNCFKDTVSVQVVVNRLPLVDAGPDVEVLTGLATQLSPVTSNDVIAWNWTPADYLNCNTCASPETKPLRPLTYTLTVKNAAGCTASDTVQVKLLCSGSRIFVPTAFTPNVDGKNDRFRIRAEGIKQIRFFRIFNRWGELVFERTNFNPDDLNAAWDGKHNGTPVSAGTYVYFAELSCNENVFQQKGTVSVVR